MDFVQNRSISINNDIRYYALHIPLYNETNSSIPEPESYTLIFFFHEVDSNYWKFIKDYSFHLFGKENKYITIVPDSQTKQNCKDATFQASEVLPCYEQLKDRKYWDIGHVENGNNAMLGSQYQHKSRCDSKDVRLVSEIYTEIESIYVIDHAYAFGVGHGGMFSYYLSQCLDKKIENFVSYNGGVVIANMESIQKLVPQIRERVETIPFLPQMLTDYPIYLAKETTGIIIAHENMTIDEFDSFGWSNDLNELFYQKGYNSVLLSHSDRFKLSSLVTNTTIKSILTYFSTKNETAFANDEFLRIRTPEGKFSKVETRFTTCVDYALYSVIAVIVAIIVAIIICIICCIVGCLLVYFCCCYQRDKYRDDYSDRSRTRTDSFSDRTDSFHSDSRSDRSFTGSGSGSDRTRSYTGSSEELEEFSGEDF